MPRITLELIRKKSEHHEGLLADMQELSLHQLNLERIELLSNVCRRLRILYLQNNLIGKMENLNRLKELRYLNLALNNIVCIENIEGCEKLERLDLTVNFVDIDRLEESLQSLQNLDFFEDLTLMGNPCTEFPEYRAVVIAMLPRLKRLDGKDVSITERLAASTNKERLLQALREASKQRREERNVEEDEDNEEAEEAESAGKTNNVGQEVPEVSISTSTSTTTTTSTSTSTSTSNSKSSGPLIEVVDANDEEEEEEEGRAERAKEKKRAAAVRKASEKKQRYTPASRLKMYLDEVEAQKKKDDEKKASPSEFAPAPDLLKEAYDKLNQKVVPPEDGSRPTQRNPGKYEFTLMDNSSRGPLVLDVAVPRYLDTSAIDVDIHPTWIQCIIKGKNLLLHFDCEIDVTNSKVQRVLANGHLVVTMPRLSASTSSGVVRGVLGEEVAAAPAATTSTSTTSSYSSAADSLKPRSAKPSVGAPPPSIASVSTSTSSSSSSTPESSAESDAKLGLKHVSSRVSRKLMEERAAKEKELEEQRLTRIAAELEAKERAAKAQREKNRLADKDILEYSKAKGVDLDELPDLE